MLTQRVEQGGAHVGAEPMLLTVDLRLTGTTSPGPGAACGAVCAGARSRRDMLMVLAADVARKFRRLQPPFCEADDMQVAPLERRAWTTRHFDFF
jgi:hypothetical protein